METTKQISPQQRWNDAHKDKVRQSNRELYQRNKHDPEFLKKRNDAVKKHYHAKKEHKLNLKNQIAKDLVDKEIERRIGIIKEELKQKFENEFKSIMDKLKINV